MFTVYSVNWRNARSVYASPRTSTVTLHPDEVPTDGLLASKVAHVGHYEEPRGFTTDDVVIRGYLRVFEVEHPRYASHGSVRDLATEQLAPWEELAYVPNEGDRWGDNKTRQFARPIYPSSAYCVTCDCDASDAVAPWSVGMVTVDGRSITAQRNIRTHLDCHRYGDALVENGTAKSYTVYPDRCG